MTERELRDYVPFLAIKDGAVLSKRGDVTFGWKVTLPIAYTVNEAGYDSIIRSFMQAYRLLPSWCVVHKQDVFCYDRYHAKKEELFLDQAYENHFEGREYLNCHTYIYLTFSTKATIEKKDAESGFFGIIDRKMLSTERLQTCADIASQFESVFKNNPLLRLKAMESEDFLCMGPDGRDQGVIADYLRAYDLSGPDYNFDFFKDRIEYGDKQMKFWYVQDSDAYPGTVSSVKFMNSMSSGSSKVFLSGGSPIGYNLRIPHVVNRYVLTLPKSTVEKELDIRKRVMTSFSLYSHESSVNAAELETYLLDSANNSTTTVKCFMDLVAWPTTDELANVRNAVVTAFQADLDVSVVEETRTAPLLHFAGIPGAAAELGYNNYLTSEITAFLCHGLWDGYDFGMRDGVVRVCNRSSMTPMRIDIQSKARAAGRINNMNALVVGPSGSGKSFTMNSLAQDFYREGEHMVVIDIGDSYQGLCALINEESGGKDGVYNTYDPEHPYAFNPFKGREHWNDTDDEGDRTSSGEDFVLSIIQTIYQPEKGWDTTSSAVLKFILSQFLSWWDGSVPQWVQEDLRESYANYQRQRAERNHKKFDDKKAMIGWKDPVTEVFPFDRKGKDPLFDHFYQYVTRIVSPLMRDENFLMNGIHITSEMLDMDKFGAAMDMFRLGGTYGFLLNAETEADLFNSRFTVFEVDKIKDNKDLFPLWILCIMHSFEDKMRGLQCQKVMIIEEAWKAISTKSMEKFIVWLWRTARKFSTSAIVVTQDISDLTGSDIIKGAIIQNSDVRILLDQRKNANNFQQAVEVLGLTPMATNLVLSVNTNLLPGYRYKEGYFAIGTTYSNVFAIEVSDEQAILFETDKTLKKPLFDLARELGSMKEAVRTLAAERRARRNRNLLNG